MTELKGCMIFSKKSFIWTVAFAAVGIITVYPIFALFGQSLIGLAGVLVFGVIGFIISSAKMPNSTNFEILRKTGGEDIDEILLRLIKFKKKGGKIYLYYKGGNDNE